MADPCVSAIASETGMARISINQAKNFSGRSLTVFWRYYH